LARRSRAAAKAARQRELPGGDEIGNDRHPVEHFPGIEEREGAAGFQDACRLAHEQVRAFQMLDDVR